MRFSIIGIAFSGLIALLSCESKDVKPTSALVRIYVSSIPIDNSIGIVSARFNYVDAIYSRVSSNDSIYCKETFLSNLWLIKNSYKADSAKIPYGSYNSLSFYRWHSSSEPAQLFWIEGTIGKTSFVFYNGERFTINFHNTLNISDGGTIDLLVNVNLNKTLNPQKGGVDITKAVDGDGDGTIFIEPSNIDGNAALAEQIYALLITNITCDVNSQ